MNIEPMWIVLVPRIEPFCIFCAVHVLEPADELTILRVEDEVVISVHGGQWYLVAV